MSFDVEKFLNDATQGAENLIQQKLNNPEYHKDGYLILKPRDIRGILFSCFTFALYEQGHEVLAVNAETGKTIDVTGAAREADPREHKRRAAAMN